MLAMFSSLPLVYMFFFSFMHATHFFISHILRIIFMILIVALKDQILLITPSSSWDQFDIMSR
jgi:hypothetical protein